MINTKIKNLSSRPGVYKFLDKNSKILYIGKASNLKKRVSSYFNKSVSSIKTTKMVDNISNLETIITENEEEALILENTLIKKFKPKYNILLRDDKSYPYIYIDTSHSYPSIKFYRGPKKNKKGYFFGPYTHVNHVRYMLNLLQKIFKTRSCENYFFSIRKKPCLQYQINRCTAPCVDLISQDDYQETIHNSVLFLQGKNDSLINKYDKQMMEYSDNQEYEKATIIRDKIWMIRNLTKSKNVINNQKEMDILTISSSDLIICIDVFLVRDGANLGNKTYEFSCENNSINIILNSFIKQYYFDNVPPEKILVPEKFPDLKILTNILSKKYHKNIKIIHAIRNPYLSWIRLCQTNTDDRLKLVSATNNKNDYFGTISLDLNYKKKINNVICLDISHLSGSNMQGACVWYDNSGMKKENYRRYNLNNIKRSDDYAALRYVLNSRLVKLQESNNLPDLILIDGGKGQISQACAILTKLNIKNLPILGIVKGHKRKTKYDRILNSDQTDITLMLSENSVRVLQSIRDEAHRFAITGQRKKTENKQFESRLDSIPGIGKVRKLHILKYFGGIQGVLKSSLNEIAKVPGINSQLADIIYKHLHSK